MPPAGLEAAFLANRDKLLRFLRARGAGEAAEDLVQDLWLKVRATGAPVANPLSYLYRAADMLMIDRYRASRQAGLRERAWSEAHGWTDGASVASDEARVAAREEATLAHRALAGLGPRRETVFRRVRLDGIAQRQVAAEMGISISTVESDLRAAAVALAALRDRLR